jgi:hypothetical protein
VAHGVPFVCAEGKTEAAMPQGMERSSVQRMNRLAARTSLAALAALVFVGGTEVLAQTKDNVVKLAPEANTEVREQQHRRIVVSIADRKLALVENDKVMKIYRVAVGAKVSPSPQGDYTIVHRIPEPTYYAPGVIMPPGKDNPLGTRWVGLSAKGFGIHGTNQPHSIGRNLSHGCIRMRNRDVEDLFARVRVGDVVELAGERTAEIARIFGGAPSAAIRAAAGTAKAEATAETEETENDGQTL